MDKRMIDRSALKDILDVNIDMNLPREERMKQYVKQIGDPYCYLDGDVVVEIGYADTKVTLHDCLVSYANSINMAKGTLW